MGTRSDIIAHCADGKWRRIYCHWDGYLSHNGKILFEHYTSQALVEALLDLGCLSVLGPKIGRKHPFDKPRSDTPAYAEYERKYAGMCLAYIRDRGMGNWHYAKTREEFLAAESALAFDTLSAAWPESDACTEFTYVWCANPAVAGDQPGEHCKWWVGDPDESSQTLVDLGEALLGNKVVAPKVKAFGVNFVIGQHLSHDPKKPDSHNWRGSI